MAEGTSISGVWLAGVCSGIVGAALILLMWLFGPRTVGHREASRRRLAAWLAAYIGVGRASVSFVAAFRSLAAAAEGSPHYPLRIEEAQRARTHWVRAVHRLDVAEADLHIWHPGSAVVQCVDRLPRVSPASLRDAVDGTDADADGFLQTVLAMQREATVAMAHVADARYGARFRVLIGQTLARAEAIVDAWARK